MAPAVCYGYPSRVGYGIYHNVVTVVRLVKNLGIDIPSSIERIKRSMQHAPSKRKDTFEIQAKKDFEYYRLPVKRRHPDYR